MMQPLIADGGELTVLRSLASHAWGRWKVEWPESVPEEQRPHVDEDREIGFVYKMERPVGRMGRRFVHEDVSVTAADYGPDGVVLPHSGVSDVEAVLDAAAARTDGDAFFEREITREGLGPLTPYEDFDVGDVVSVSIWGRVMDQPVTSIEAVSEAGAVIDWKVHVGGSLLADDAARRRSNEDLERTIAQERRERLKSDAKIETQAVAAQSTADAAVEDAAAVRAVLGGPGAPETTLVAQLAAINAQIQSQGGQAQPGLLPMYIQMNTRLWEQQQIIDATQDAMQQEQAVRLAAHDELLDATQTQIAKARSNAWQITLPGEGRFVVSDKTITAVGDWVGDAVLDVTSQSYSYVSTSSGSTNVPTYPREIIRAVVGAQRSWTVSNGSIMTAIFHYRTSEGAVHKVSAPLGRMAVGMGWTTVNTMTATYSGTHSFEFRIGWDAANLWSTYGMRITVDGVAVAETSDNTLGPVFPSGNGYEVQQLAKTVNVNKGQTVRFEAYCNKDKESSRVIRDGVARAWWVE